MTPIWPHISETESCLELKLGTHIKYHIIFFVWEMEQNPHPTFWENAEKAHFCPFLAPFYPVSQEQKLFWTWNLAHIWRILLSFFSRIWNQIVNLDFEKMPKTPIFALFWPPFTPYLKNRNLSGLETWHTYAYI